MVAFPLNSTSILKFLLSYGRYGSGDGKAHELPQAILACLLSLGQRIDKLSRSGVFPYNATPLLSLIRSLEPLAVERAGI